MKILKQVLLLCFLLPCASAECSEVQLVEVGTWSPRLPIQSDAELSYIRLNPDRRNHHIQLRVQEDGRDVYSVVLDEEGDQTTLIIGFLDDTWSWYQPKVGFRLERPETRLRLAYYNSNRTLNVALYDEGSQRWKPFHRDGGPVLGTGNLGIVGSSPWDSEDKFLIKLPCPQMTELEEDQRSFYTLLMATIISTVNVVILVGSVVFTCYFSRCRRPGPGEETPGGGMAMQETTTQSLPSPRPILSGSRNLERPTQDLPVPMWLLNRPRRN